MISWNKWVVKDIDGDIEVNSDQGICLLPLTIESESKGGKVYNYSHLGAIQIWIRPLFKKGIESPIQAYIIDSRARSFGDALISGIEANLKEGTVGFNCRPNYWISLKEPNLNNLLYLIIDISKFQNKFVRKTKILSIRFKTIQKHTSALIKEECNNSIVLAEKYLNPKSPIKQLEDPKNIIISGEKVSEINERLINLYVQRNIPQKRLIEPTPARRSLSGTPLQIKSTQEEKMERE